MGCLEFFERGREDAFTITGTEGLVFSLLGDEPLRLENSGGVQMLSRPNPPHVQQPLIQSVVDDLLGRGECPSTGETARRASQIMDAVLTGYYGGRADETDHPRPTNRLRRAGLSKTNPSG